MDDDHTQFLATPTVTSGFFISFPVAMISIEKYSRDSSDANSNNFVMQRCMIDSDIISAIKSSPMNLMLPWECFLIVIEDSSLSS